MFAEQRYVSIATRKHNQTWVWTPVWVASLENDHSAFYLFSAGRAGKVKRVRNYKEAQIAPCTALGKILGHAVPAQAWLEDRPTVCELAYRALRSKYGWQMRLLDFFSKLAGSYNQRQLVGFRLVREEGATGIGAD